MTVRGDHKRVLIYSHDTFGLGHLRRCRAIAHSLVEANPALSVLILSGSPIIGSFDFRSRVDFVRVPGVIKLRNGEYVSLSLHIDIEETLAMRSSIIRHTAAIFDPEHIATRLAALLDLLLAVPVPLPPRIVPVAGIAPAMLVTRGTVGMTRHGAVTIRMSDHPVRTEAAEAVSADGLRRAIAQVAEELAARLDHTFGGQRR